MRFPWQKIQPEPNAEPSVDLEALARSAAQEAATQAVGEMGAEIARALIASSPMQGAPVAGTSGSPYPLYAYDNPITYSTPQAPTRRPGSIVTLDMLRRLADTYDILRSCINHLKREVSAVPLEIIAKDPADKGDTIQKRIQEAKAFFETAGGLGGPGRRRSHFESEIIEDLCVIGSAALYYRPNLGGTLYEAIAIDAATIRPKVDAFGWPGPGEAVYEQWVQGLKIAEFTREQMTFDGIYPVSNSPYFKSPVEWLINTVNAALRSDDWNLSWLTDGNTPSDLLALPEQWTPGQVREWSEFWDSLYAGNSQKRQKSKFVPGGTQRVGNPSRKDNDFQEFMLWLLRRTCSIMGVQPASIGFAGEQYKVSQGDSMDSTSDFGAGVLLDFRRAIYDDVLGRLGYPDLKTENVTKTEEKAIDRATKNTALVSGGIKTINEARAEEGLDPVPDGDVVLVPSTLRPLEQALEPPEPPTAPGGGGPPKTAADRSDVIPRGINGDNDYYRDRWSRRRREYEELIDES